MAACFPRLKVEEEATDELSGYSIDIVLHEPRQTIPNYRGSAERVAIEVDGPSHYTQKGGAEDSGQRIVQAPTGNTLMKHRHLTKLGWKLVSLPYWTWNEVSRWDNEAQRQFWLAELSLKR